MPWTQVLEPQKGASGESGEDIEQGPRAQESASLEATEEQLRRHPLSSAAFLLVPVVQRGATYGFQAFGLFGNEY